MWSEFQNLFVDISNFSLNTYPQLVKSKAKLSLINDLKNASQFLLENNLKLPILLCIFIIGALIITLIRYLITNYFVKDFLMKNGYILTRDYKKFSESFWSFSFYLNSFLLSAYIVHNSPIYPDGKHIFDDYSIDSSIPISVQILYYAEISYYLHSGYAVFFLNTWKQDSPLMFVHHIVAFSLIFFSLLTRTYLVGVFTLYLHDICDIFLEGFKSIVKLQFRIIQTHQSILRTMGFSFFIVAWFRYRLYYFPLIVLKSSLKFINDIVMEDWFIFIYLLFLLLLAIYFMNIYWATLIIKLVLKVMLNREEVDDLREMDDELQENNPNDGDRNKDSKTIIGNETKPKQS